jgi:hypothetical protein
MPNFGLVIFENLSICVLVFSIFFKNVKVLDCILIIPDTVNFPESSIFDTLGCPDMDFF